MECYSHNAICQGYAKNECLCEEVVVPDGAETVLPSAFENCRHLKKVIMPPSVIFVGSNAFKGCDKIESITMPDTAVVDNGVFNDVCTTVKEINLTCGIKNKLKSVFPNADIKYIDSIRIEDLAQRIQRLEDKIAS